MKHKKFAVIIALLTIILSTPAALEIQKNDMRIFAGTANDKFAYGLSQNKHVPSQLL